LRGSSGSNALLLVEGKPEGKKASGRPRRTWVNDLLQWTQQIMYHEVKRLAEDREAWRKETHKLS